MPSNCVRKDTTYSSMWMPLDCCSIIVEQQTRAQANAKAYTTSPLLLLLYYTINTCYYYYYYYTICYCYYYYYYCYYIHPRYSAGRVPPMLQSMDPQPDEKQSLKQAKKHSANPFNAVLFSASVHYNILCIGVELYIIYVVPSTYMRQKHTDAHTTPMRQLPDQQVRFYMNLSYSGASQKYVLKRRWWMGGGSVEADLLVYRFLSTLRWPPYASK